VLLTEFYHGSELLTIKEVYEFLTRNFVELERLREPFKDIYPLIGMNYFSVKGTEYFFQS